MYLDVLNLNNVSCQNVIDGLGATSISCPALDRDLLATYFAYFIQSGFLDRPEQSQLLPLAQLLRLPLSAPVTELVAMT